MSWKYWPLAVLAILLCFAKFGYSDPLKLKLGADIEEKYNDNVYFQTNDAQEDFITRMSPWLQGGWETEALTFRLNGRADIFKYADNKELDAVDQSYDALLAQQWSPRFSLSFKAAYMEDERPERELPETGLLLGDDTRRRHIFSVGGQYHLGEVSRVSMNYTYQNDDFEDDLTYDLALHSVQLVLDRDLASFARPTTGRLKLVGGYYEYQREFSAVETVFDLYRQDVYDEQSIEYYALRLGVAHARTERLNVDMEMGARFTRKDRRQDIDYEPNPFLTDASVQEDNESWGYVAALAVDYVGEKWAMNLLASHDLVPASGREGTTERTTLRCGGERRFGSRWYGNLSTRAYLNRSDDDGVTREEDELTVQVRGGVRYAFTPHWSLGGYWLTTWIDDRVANLEKTQNTLSLRLRWEWPIAD